MVYRTDEPTLSVGRMKFVAKLPEWESAQERLPQATWEYGGCKRPSPLLALELRPRRSSSRLPDLLAIVALDRPTCHQCHLLDK